MSVKDVDSHKLWLHPERVAEWKQYGVCFPLQAEIGITDKCNHKCFFCTLDWITHGNTALEESVLLKTIEEMARHGVKSIYFAGEGEPTLHKSLGAFVHRARYCGMGASLSTNGSLFSQDLAKEIVPHLSWVRFSIDSATSKTFSKIHGVKKSEFKNVIDNVIGCVQEKNESNSSVNIGTQLILMPENIDEVVDCAKMMKEIGVDNFQVKPCHSHPESSHNPHIYEFAQTELEKKLETLNTEKFTTVVRTKSAARLFEKRNYRECFGFDFYTLIDAHGNVVPCNIFYGKEEYYFGNIYKERFQDIWFGDRKRRIIEKIVEENHSMCGEYRCRLDVINRDLFRIKNPEQNDEFI